MNRIVIPRPWFVFLAVWLTVLGVAATVAIVVGTLILLGVIPNTTC